MRKIRVAMIGQRGLPATFGGIEHHVEQLGSRIAAFGHDVTVYCRSNYSPKELTEHLGMRLRHPPTVGTKHLDAIAHSASSTLSAMAGRFDIVHYHGLGPGLLSPLPRYLSAAGVVQTVHGMDNRRAKWGAGARAVLTAAAWASARVPDRTIVVSQTLKEHYRGLGRNSVYIANGVSPRTNREPDEIVRRWGLEKNGYLLFVGRLVPEKCPDQLIRCFQKLSEEVKLVIVGGSSFTNVYARGLAEAAADDDRIIMAGWVYGSLLEELYSNAAAFVLPSSLEGLPLTLLEAAAHGTPCIASDIACNVEVLGSDGPGHRLFPAGDDTALVDALCYAVEDPERERAGTAGLQRDVLSRYDWDEAARRTVEVYEEVLDR
ncbi:MAG TPA: glycosyltransferase family 4 protein [Actinomycetota bacterium]|nr:glycosyltransferase family 4 protein [Actinomycetota bacterium]